MPDSGGPKPNPAERLAAFAAALRSEDVPSEVRERARHLILDALGVAAASSRQEFARVMLDGFRAVGSVGESGVVAMGAQFSLRDAAALNAALIHGLDFDDTHPGAVVHCTAVSLPAALALGEERDAPGEEILTAYIAAMECAARIGLAADYGFHRQGFHATGIAGHFSSALAAGRLMGLDAGALASAQGVCVSTAAASREFWSDGAWNKRLHPGWAAEAGITAAGLAGAGFKGCERPYDGRFGLFRMLMGEEAEGVDYSLLADGLGERWELLESAVKPFPTCHYTHAIIDSAIALRRDHGLEPDNIAGITVLVHEDLIAALMEPEALKRMPPEDYAARFSAPWAAACGLALGRLGLAELEPQALSQPAGAGAGRPGRVPVRTRTRSSRAISPPASRSRPGRARASGITSRSIAAPATGRSITPKSWRNSTPTPLPALGEARAAAMAAHVLDMERLSGRELMRELIPAAPGCDL